MRSVSFRSCLRSGRRLAFGVAWCAIGMLAGCGTKVPLPPMPPLKPLPPLVITPPPAAASSAPTGLTGVPVGTEPPAETLPVPSSPPPFQQTPVEAAAGANGAPAATEPPPYSDAVAARFPDPAIDYFTPAFVQGHPGYTTTGELHSFLQGLTDRPQTGTSIQLLNLGNSQRGQPLDAVLFTRVPDSAAASLLASGRPTVLLMAQQHGDEPAGAEALIVLAQRLARPELQSLLDRINVIVMPRVNPDGADANLHVTANGIDASRDHLLLRTPEAQAVATLMRDYKPMVVVDAHEYTVVGRYLDKFNAVQRYDALVQYAMTANLHEFVGKASDEWFRVPMLAALNRESLTTQWLYTTSPDVADKKLAMGDVQPVTVRNVAGLQNAVGLVIETRGVGIGRQNLKRRVHAQVTAMTSVLRSAATRSADLLKLRAYVEAEVASKVCQGEVTVEASETASEYRVVMLDPVTGADKPMLVSWDSALELTTLKKRARPCGYWLSADAIDAAQRLRSLGATVQQLQENGVVQAEAYAETARQRIERPDAVGVGATGGASVAVKVALKPALMDVPSGSYYVGLDQPLAALIVAAMEPDTQSSYVAGGIIPRVEQQARVTLPPKLRLAVLP